MLFLSPEADFWGVQRRAPHGTDYHRTGDRRQEQETGWEDAATWGPDRRALVLRLRRRSKLRDFTSLECSFELLGAVTERARGGLRLFQSHPCGSATAPDLGTSKAETGPTPASLQRPLGLNPALGVEGLGEVRGRARWGGAGPCGSSSTPRP